MTPHRHAKIAKIYYCVITNEPLVYCGRGRPPKYSDAGRSVAVKKRNADAYAARKAIAAELKALKAAGQQAA